MVFRTIYISSVRTAPDASVVADILSVSQSNNRRDGLTGLLIFDGQRFLQYIEGPEDRVRARIAKIRADWRHHALVILSERTTDRRQFGGWDMAGHVVGRGETLAQCVARQTGGCDAEVADELVGFAQIRSRAA